MWCPFFSNVIENLTNHQTDSLGSQRAPLLHRRKVGKGRDVEKPSATPGEGGTAASAPQISACSFLWLTVIYADFFFFFLFFPTHAKRSTHLSQSSLWEFVRHLECDFVLLFPACRAMCHICIYYKPVGRVTTACWVQMRKTHNRPDSRQNY